MDEIGHLEREIQQYRVRIVFLENNFLHSNVIKFPVINPEFVLVHKAIFWRGTGKDTD